jgi:hypothetical protein
MIVPALAMLQDRLTAWVQTRVLGYDTPTFGTGPYEATVEGA